jgi:hypothetical protein
VSSCQSESLAHAIARWKTKPITAKVRHARLLAAHEIHSAVVHWHNTGKESFPDNGPLLQLNNKPILIITYQIPIQTNNFQP